MLMLTLLAYNELMRGRYTDLLLQSYYYPLGAF